MVMKDGAGSHGSGRLPPTRGLRERHLFLPRLQVLFFFGSLQLAVVDLLCEGRYAALMVEKPHTGEYMTTHSPTHLVTQPTHPPTHSHNHPVTHALSVTCPQDNIIA